MALRSWPSEVPSPHQRMSRQFLPSFSPRRGGPREAFNHKQLDLWRTLMTILLPPSWDFCVVWTESAKSLPLYDVTNSSYLIKSDFLKGQWLHSFTGKCIRPRTWRAFWWTRSCGGRRHTCRRLSRRPRWTPGSPLCSLSSTFCESSNWKGERTT